jgi:hypothetical protein
MMLHQNNFNVVIKDLRNAPSKRMYDVPFQSINLVTATANALNQRYPVIMLLPVIGLSHSIQWDQA